MPKTVLYGGREIPWALRPTEKVVQQNCVRLLKLAGFEVSSHSQYRASHVAVGVPDLHLFHERLRCSGWWETKRPGEALTPAQLTWRERCLRTSTLHGWGTDEDLKPWLVALGLARVAPGCGCSVFGLRVPSGWPDGANESAEVAARITAASQRMFPESRVV